MIGAVVRALRAQLLTVPRRATDRATPQEGEGQALDPRVPSNRVPEPAAAPAPTPPACSTCNRDKTDLWWTPKGRQCRFCMAIEGVEL